MASMIHFPNTTINQHVTFPTNTCSRSASFGQICLPKKADVATAVTAAATKLAARTGTTLTTITTSTNSVFGSTSTTSSLADEWREIHGSNNWENMVDPLHPLLRQEIIRYGNLVNACYKVFDLNPNSKRYLNCKYGKRNMFREIGMDGCGYDVTKYIYATPDINIPIQHGESCCRWMGYVAVSSDDAVKRLGRRDILISFRGTVTHPEWVANLMSSLTPARLDPQNPRDDVKVESGFLSMYTSDESESKFGLKSCREQLLSEVSRLLSKYRSEDVSITLAGHSMGSSLALLLGYDIAELGLNRGRNSRTRTPITVFSFGGPRVGNSGFKERCEELGVKVLRVVNVNDPITKMPGVVFNHENFRVFGGGSSFEFPWSCSCYAHVGVELMLDFFNMQDPACVHDMGAYISLLKSCPKRVQIEKEGADLMKRAKEMLANLNTSTRNLNMPTLSIPWRSSVSSASATSNMVNLQVQSQRT